MAHADRRRRPGGGRRCRQQWHSDSSGKAGRFSRKREESRQVPEGRRRDRDRARNDARHGGAAPMKTLKLLLVVIFAAAWSSSILAQAVSPIHARGFEADKVYAVDDIDAVNLLNGNVNVPIPLGIKYSVGPQLSYQFTLVYGGNNWESESYDELPNDVHPNQTWTYTWAYPSWRDNAGLGWRLTLGRLYGAGASGCTPPGTAGLMAYESPDGSVHCFYTALHEGHNQEKWKETPRN